MSEHDPSTCFVCTRHAVGIGLSAKPPYNWICKECVVAFDDLTRIKRPSVYELQARQGGMDAAGPLIEEFGSDLAEYTEEQALRLVGAIWRGCADELRRLVREGEAPF